MTLELNVFSACTLRPQGTGVVLPAVASRAVHIEWRCHDAQMRSLECLWRSLLTSGTCIHL